MVNRFGSHRYKAQNLCLIKRHSVLLLGVFERDNENDGSMNKKPFGILSILNSKGGYDEQTNLTRSVIGTVRA
jgi:hypothetical protein